MYPCRLYPPPTKIQFLFAHRGITEYLLSLPYGEEDKSWITNDSLVSAKLFPCLPWNLKFRIWLRRKALVSNSIVDPTVCAAQTRSFLYSILVEAQRCLFNHKRQESFQNQGLTDLMLDQNDDQSERHMESWKEDPMLLFWAQSQRLHIIQDVTKIFDQLVTSDQRCLQELIEVIDTLKAYNVDESSMQQIQPPWIFQAISKPNPEASDANREILHLVRKFCHSSLASHENNTTSVVLPVSSITNNGKETKSDEKDPEMSGVFKDPSFQSFSDWLACCLSNLDTRQHTAARPSESISLSNDATDKDTLKRLLREVGRDGFYGLTYHKIERSILQQSNSGSWSDRDCLRRLYVRLTSVDDDDEEAVLLGRACMLQLFHSNKVSIRGNSTPQAVSSHIVEHEKDFADLSTAENPLQVVQDYLVKKPLTTRTLCHLENLTCKLWDLMMCNSEANEEAAAQRTAQIRLSLQAIERYSAFLPVRCVLQKMKRLLAACFGKCIDEEIERQQQQHLFQPMDNEHALSKLANATSFFDALSAAAASNNREQRSLERSTEQSHCWKLCDDEIIFLLFSPLCCRVSLVLFHMHETDTFRNPSSSLIVRRSLSEGILFCSFVASFMRRPHVVEHNLELAALVDLLMSLLQPLETQLLRSETEACKEIFDRLSTRCDGLNKMLSIHKLTPKMLNLSSFMASLIEFCQLQQQHLVSTGWCEHFSSRLPSLFPKQDVGLVWTETFVAVLLKYDNRPKIAMLTKEFHKNIVERFFGTRQQSFLESLLSCVHNEASSVSNVSVWKVIGMVLLSSPPEYVVLGCSQQKLETLMSECLPIFSKDYIIDDVLANLVISLALSLPPESNGEQLSTLSKLFLSELGKSPSSIQRIKRIKLKVVSELDQRDATQGAHWWETLCQIMSNEFEKHREALQDPENEPNNSKTTVSRLGEMDFSIGSKRSIVALGSRKSDLAKKQKTLESFLGMKSPHYREAKTCQPLPVSLNAQNSAQTSSRGVPTHPEVDDLESLNDESDSDEILLLDL